MKKQFVLYFTTVFLFGACKNDSQQESSLSEGFLSNTVDFIVEQRADQSIEFPFLYDSLITNIPEDPQEHLQLVELLKNKGFKITHYGRGNYPPRGPRIVSVDMTNETCHCNVSKIYYFTVADHHYEVAERITCKKKPSNE